jgi:hypothetical protein
VEADAVLLGDKVGRIPLRARDEGGRCEAWLTLDGRDGVEGLLQVERWGPRGREAVLHRSRVAVAANASRRLWQSPRKACGVQDPSVQYLCVRFTTKDGRERRSLLFFERPKHFNYRPAGLVVGARAKDDRIEVAVRAKNLAQAVELHAPVPGRFSENGFDLLPGETRRLVFIPDKPGPIKGAWQALCLNQCAFEARRP